MEGGGSSNDALIDGDGAFIDFARRGSPHVDRIN